MDGLAAPAWAGCYNPLQDKNPWTRDVGPEPSHLRARRNGKEELRRTRTASARPELPSAEGNRIAAVAAGTSHHLRERRRSKPKVSAPR